MNAQIKTLPTRPDRSGTRIALDLRTSEHSIDQTLMAIMQLGQSMIDGRLKNNLAAGVGQDALEAITRSISSAVTTRAELVAAHDLLKRTADEHSIRWTAEGPLEFKPQAETTQDAQAA
ncbi:hypothetical protein [Brevundimonas sp. A19_0]|uniref:hypothetical protein n=1 Tax=Brevundimonas sp. A19_0 TaxID=2821087 RepID=UPI001ADB41F7|nr:hypothetical protein [Brevundimonas sp. A19_0]MBO9500422.1 hypothetical protein [Brevundimonas sp. A19_0]